MKDYIFTIVGISLVCAFARMLSPDEEGKGIQIYIKLLCGLLLLCAVIDPISLSVISLQDNKGELFESMFETEGLDEGYYEKIYSSTLIGHSQESVSLGLKEMLLRELKLNAEDIDVYVELAESEEKFTPQRVTVRLYKGGIFADPRDIEDCVNRALGCECEIIYG